MGSLFQLFFSQTIQRNKEWDTLDKNYDVVKTFAEKFYQKFNQLSDVLKAPRHKSLSAFVEKKTNNSRILFQRTMMAHNFSLTLVQEISMAVDFFLNEDILSPSVKTLIIIFYSILVTIAGQFLSGMKNNSEKHWRVCSLALMRSFFNFHE